MKGRLRVAVSLAVTAFFLWLALHEVKWPEVWAHLRNANWLYLALSILVATLSIHVRALRWKSLLAPLDPDVPFQPRVAGTAVGFAANNLIPARVGEFVRALVCGKLARLPVSSVFATLVVERVFDGLITVALLFTVMALPGFPSPEKAANALNVRALPLAVDRGEGRVVIVMALMPRRSLRMAEAAAGAASRAGAAAAAEGCSRAYIGGLAVLRDTRLLAVSTGWAIPVALNPLYRSIRLLASGSPSRAICGALFLQLRDKTWQVAIPLVRRVLRAAGGGGGVRAGLWGVDESRAASFAIGYHLGGFITVTLLGLWYVQKLDLSWKELIGKAEQAEAAGGTPPVEAEPRRA